MRNGQSINAQHWRRSVAWRYYRYECIVVIGTVFEQGFALHYRSTVGDQLEELKQEIIALSLKSDIVIVNGGLGPTSDDLSALAAAQAVGKELVLNQQWVDVMTAYFARIGRPMAASNEKQAMLPQDAEMIHNPVGTACGFSIELNDAVVFFTPGCLLNLNVWWWTKFYQG